MQQPMYVKSDGRSRYFGCPACMKKFETMDYLRAHIQRRHADVESILDLSKCEVYMDENRDPTWETPTALSRPSPVSKAEPLG